jgi:16S rRNA (guanine527-N7)-methyltransferase
MSSAPRRPPLELPVVTGLPPPADLDARLAALGVALEPRAVQQLGAFLALLLAMNERLNLTAITDPAEAWSRHVLDALSLVPLLPPAGAGARARLLDVGSGGGVPGLPLAIARPDLGVTLLDATEKKVAFLRAAAAALGLANVEAISGRAEALPPAEERFDIVTARAVAKLSTLIGWTAPFAARGGRLLLVKGAQADAELRDAAPVLRRFRCEHERTVQTPTGRIVVLRVGS